MFSIIILVQLEKKLNQKRFSNKNYTNYIQGDNLNSFFITPTDGEKVISIISSPSDNNSFGPNSIQTRILRKDI